MAYVDEIMMFWNIISEVFCLIMRCDSVIATESWSIRDEQSLNIKTRAIFRFQRAND